jgi:hypothetical protein
MGNRVMSQKAPGKVEIHFTYKRLLRVASNQFAVWIEGEDGSYIRSLYATKFTASGGYKRRENSLPEWVDASHWEEAESAEVDAVSGPTKKPGKITVVWDCKDREGGPVPPGTYVYKVEGSLYWEKRMLWTGTIEVGDKETSSSAEVAYIPEEAKKIKPMIDNVSARYIPMN